jgi:hypothetical protein
MVQAVPYIAAQSMLDAAVPYGRHNYWKSSFLRGLPEDAAAKINEYAQRITSPYALCLVEHVHGVPTRIPSHATAFSVRSEHFHFVAIASWDAADDPARHIQWTRDFWGAMQPWSAGRVYANILSYDESERVAEAYGPNYARLSEVKAQYDPLNFFRVNQNIVPAIATAG